MKLPDFYWVGWQEVHEKKRFRFIMLIGRLMVVVFDIILSLCCLSHITVGAPARSLRNNMLQSFACFISSVWNWGMIHSISAWSPPSWVFWRQGMYQIHSYSCQGQIKNCEEKRSGTRPNVVIICDEGHLKHSKFERANMGSLTVW